MLTTTSAVIALLAVAWFLQLGLSYWQMRRFYGRLSVLRREGRVSIGMEGSAWRRRQYGVLVVDPQDRILRAEQLSGWTIFAALKPVPGLEGLSLDDLDDDARMSALVPNRKLLLSLRNAAKFVREAAARARAKQAETAEPMEAVEKALPSSTPA